MRTSCIKLSWRIEDTVGYPGWDRSASTDWEGTVGLLSPFAVLPNAPDILQLADLSQTLYPYLYLISIDRLFFVESLAPILFLKILLHFYHPEYAFTSPDFILAFYHLVI